jgi:asparagine synthase (glutamine-hydrolysing)
MCGIVGLIAEKRGVASLTAVKAMANRLTHRGPDSEGYWHSGNVFLGHKRLAIVDLSNAGHQPILSADNRHVMTYNGEIYNHLELRKSIEREKTIRWRGHSDSETLVEAIALWGVEQAVTKCNGMFAFGYWNVNSRELTLARDPFGEKPLLYAHRDGAFAFASELRALCRFTPFNASIDEAAVSAYLSRWYVPADHSIVKGIKKLPPGCLLQWRPGEEPRVRQYFHLEQLASHGQLNQLSDDQAALEELDSLFRDAVRIRLMSDVPVGAFLSGGVDSSLSVAYMQELRSTPIHTFCIGHENPDYDEAPHAAAVAKHLGTRHESLTVTDRMALDTAQKMGKIFDEPFADASQIPTYLVSAFARKQVTVALSGDGCDELFSGYARHYLAERASSAISRIPMRHSLARILPTLPQPLINAAATMFSPFIPSGVNPKSLGRKLRDSGRLLRANGPQDLFNSYLTNWQDPSEIMREAVPVAATWQPPAPIFASNMDRFIWNDCTNYLPNNILVKVDRAAMAVGLETRIPALDKRIAAFSWRLPNRMRWRDGHGKWLLRQLLYKKVPRKLVDRPKMGFAVPLARWLRGPLREWAQDLLSEDRIRRQGLLSASAVSQHWGLFLNDEPQVTAEHMWALLMLQAWIESNTATT